VEELWSIAGMIYTLLAHRRFGMFPPNRVDVLTLRIDLLKF